MNWDALNLLDDALEFPMDQLPLPLQKKVAPTPPPVSRLIPTVPVNPVAKPVAQSVGQPIGRPLAAQPKSNTIIFRPSRSLREMMKEYNVWRPRHQNLIKARPLVSHSDEFQAGEKVDVIRLPSIPGKILRPA